MGLKEKFKNNPAVSYLKKLEAVRQPFLLVRYGFFQRPFFNPQIDVRLDGASFKLDYTFGLHKYDEFGNKHNSGFKKWLESCRGRFVVFDIGAHIGLYSLPASQVIDRSGKVYAFEPSSANCHYLRKHMVYNCCQNVVIEPVLVGKEPREAVPFQENPKADAMNALIVQKNPGLYRQVERRQVSLDDYCYRQHIFPEVIKIDVEGAEVQVIEGGQRLLKEKHPVIFLSVHPSRIVLLKDSVEKLVRLIKGLDYTITDTEGRPVDDDLKFGEYILKQ